MSFSLPFDVAVGVNRHSVDRAEPIAGDTLERYKVVAAQFFGGCEVFRGTSGSLHVRAIGNLRLANEPALCARRDQSEEQERQRRRAKKKAATFHNSAYSNSPKCGDGLCVETTREMACPTAHATDAPAPGD